jgi:hypothetical protein
LKEGRIIKIRDGEEIYKVKILKVLEMFPNGNGFVRVKYSTGQKRNISIRGGGKINGS